MAVEELQSIREACKQAVEANNRKIEKYENLYDSLSRFRSLSQDAGGDFQATAAKKESYLTGLSSSVPNCRSAKKYAEGMKKELHDIGVAYVVMAFKGLDISIGLKLAEYKAAIKACEASNVLLGDQLDSVAQEISDLLSGEG